MQKARVKGRKEGRQKGEGARGRRARGSLRQGEMFWLRLTSLFILFSLSPPPPPPPTARDFAAHNRKEEAGKGKRGNRGGAAVVVPSVGLSARKCQACFPADRLTFSNKFVPLCVYGAPAVTLSKRVRPPLRGFRLYKREYQLCMRVWRSPVDCCHAICMHVCPISQHAVADLWNFVCLSTSYNM